MNSLTARQFATLVAALFAVLAGLWLTNIGDRKLANPDEGRYSVLAMHMADSGDYVTPRLNGLKYFEKPPMQYWLTAFTFKVFGKSEWSARLYIALSALIVVLLVGYTAAKCFTREVGVFSALALVACPYFMALAEIITLDMGLTLWTTLSVCAFMLSQRDSQTHPPSERERFVWLCIGWIAMGGAVLSKGLIGIVFPAAILFLYCLVHWDWRRLASVNWVSGFALFFLVTVPWFALVADRNDEFLRFFFIHEHFERFTSTKHRRVEAWYFFFPILFVGVYAWAVMLIPALIRGWQHHHHANGFRPLRFAILWIGFILLFFSISGSKLPAYIAPTFPFIAIVVGFYLAATPGRRLALYLAPIPFISLGVAWFLHTAPAERARNAFELGLYTEYAAILVTAFLVLTVGSVIGIAFLWRGTKIAKRWAILTIAASSVFMVHAIDSGYETLSPLQSGYALSKSIAAKATPETRLYSVNTYDQTLPFYLGRYVTLVDYVDEFETGMEAEPNKSIPKLEDFVPAWNAPGNAIAVIPPQDKEKMAALGLQFEIIHDSPRRVAIMKKTAP